jgi:hypothetical protein
VDTPDFWITIVVHSCANLIALFIFLECAYSVTKPDRNVSPAPETSFTGTSTVG